MILEEIEQHDWKITPDMQSEERKQKSIQAYYLNEWYDKVKDITFDTHIYSNIKDVPEELPFTKSIVRYENKSPKDSEFWQPIKTKDQLINLFYTSLRCKTNKGKYYCVREFKELGDEYRCFWDNGLLAISSESESKPDTDSIIKYILSIKSYIPYHRCVFDIAELTNDPNNKYTFVEFNSWETNAGAHRFNWNENTELFYSVDRYNYTTNNNDQVYKCIGMYSAQYVGVRWNGGEDVQYNPYADLYVTEKYCDMLKVPDLFELYSIVDDNNYLNTLFTDNYIYCSNDVWLGKFDRFTLECVGSVRGIFRFSQLDFCSDGKIYDGENYYYPDLTPFTISQYSTKPIVVKRSNLNTSIKYGFVMKNKKNKQECYLRLLSDFEFMLDLGTIKFIIDKNF